MNFLKIFKIIFVVLIVFVLVGALGFFIILSAVDANQMRTFIEQQLTNVSGQQVAIGELEFVLSLKQGVVLHGRDVQVSALNGESKNENIFLADTLNFGVALIPLLTKQQLIINNIEFDGIVINIIRGQDGRFNVMPEAKSQSELLENNTQDTQAQKTPEPDFSSGKAKPRIDFSTKLLIEKIRLDDIEINYRDFSQGDEKSFQLSRGVIGINDFAFNKRVGFEARFGLFDKRQNLNIKGNSIINMQNKQARMDDVHIDLVFDQVPLKKVNALVETGMAFTDRDRVSLEFEGTIHQMVLDQNGILVLLSSQHIQQGFFDVAPPLIPVKNIELQSEITEADFVINRLSCAVAGGSLEGKGRISEFLSDQRTGSVELQLGNLLLDQILTGQDIPFRIEGKAFSQINAQSRLTDDMTGEGFIDIKEARIVDFNLFNFVMDKLSVIPNLSDRITKNLTPDMQKVFSQNDTIFETVEFDAELKGETVYVKKGLIQTAEMAVLATAQCDLDYNLEMDAQLFIESYFSEKLTDKVDELNFLRDDQGRIRIPFFPYRGKLNKLTLYPDIQYVGEKIFENKGKSELKKALYKAFDIDEEDSADNSTETPTNESRPQEEKRPEEVLIENVLDAFF